MLVVISYATVAHYAEVLGVSLQYLINENCTDRSVTTQAKNRTSPEETVLSEGEKMWLELYHRLSSETRDLLIETIGSFDSLSEDKQKLALQMLRVALGGQ